MISDSFREGSHLFATYSLSGIDKPGMPRVTFCETQDPWQIPNSRSN
jgi:hypothetical protein